MTTNSTTKKRFIVEDVPVDKIVFSPLNPRSEGVGEDIEELVADITSSKNGIVQPPDLEKIGDIYRVIAGARRVLAAKKAGRETVTCHVYTELNPIDAHYHRLSENLHRKPLHPYDTAVSLRTTWYIENALAMGLGDKVETILTNEEKGLYYAMQHIEQLLLDNGFVQTNPRVSWGDMLDKKGIEMEKGKRKRLLRLLLIDPNIIDKIRVIQLTEASLLSIGNLCQKDQLTLADALLETPDIANKVRRIASVVTTKDYTIEEAIAEARGIVYIADEEENNADDNNFIDDYLSENDEEGGEDDESEERNSARSKRSNYDDEGDDALAGQDVLSEETTKAIVTFLELSDRLKEVVDNINTCTHGKRLKELPQPWGEYVMETRRYIMDTVGELS